MAKVNQKLNKIEKYGLEARTLELQGMGHSTTTIARILTEELPQGTSISQSVVSRHLKNVRVARTEQTRRIYEEHINAVLPSDLKALEIGENLLFTWMNDTTLTKTERARFLMDMAKVIDTKLKYSGLLQDPSKGPGIAHPVDLNEYRTEEEDSGDADEIQTH